jgi:predicted nucleic acid-binding protein
MTSKSVLLDTNFFIHFLQEESQLYKNANGYFKYFCEHNIKMKISTISIAEYCVIGSLDELPLKDVQIVPFNMDHAIKTGEFAKYVFERKNQISVERKIIPNDTKLFAQADVDHSVEFYFFFILM